jgi:hypothetical protein
LGELLPVGLYAEPVARLFLLENQIMNATTNYLNAVSAHLKAGKTLRQALEALTPIYNKAKFDEQQAIKMQVAQLVGKEYGVKPVTTNRGLVSFDRTTKKGDAARKLLTYYFPTTLKTKAKPKVSKQVDVVESLLAKVYALPKADRARFIALIKKDSK